MKTSHSSAALVLRSGKAVLCFILVHIHDYHAFGFKTWDQRVFAPVVECAAVNIVLKVIKRKQYLFIESTDDVGSLFTLPVVAIDTGFTNRCITMRANGLVLKATFIHINDGIALLFKSIKLTLIYRSFYQTGFWML